MHATPQQQHACNACSHFLMPTLSLMLASGAAGNFWWSFSGSIAIWASRLRLSLSGDPPKSRNNTKQRASQC
eukprot:3466758-Pyramimonas_sp.AAC.1